ncbi:MULTISPECIES: hypothetical protein [Serratia]|uniref:hypothetical protein n=1 Tax=Serratia TaxID=613 RepID=UPI00217B6996|nr:MULTISPECIES: hypothetical protein [Serratia]CAI1037285.1 Uncharacterised protein [Serratia proteamaculans]CAI1890674.1 Uncharacterised protein [Serratia quinivorans]CAI2119771.1 Uncharacterised protein [Serratia proteamaculans]
MKINKLFICIVYCFVFFLVFIVVLKVGINLLKFGELSFTQQSFKDSLVVSGIVGVAAGVGSWIFAKIDEYNANKKSSSDKPPES